DKWSKKFISVKDRILVKRSEQIKFVAGVDISYPTEENPKRGIACAVLMDIKKSTEIEKAFYEGQIEFPYVPGLLAFREAPLLAKAIFKLKKQPDLIMCDGHGYAHPKRFGEAVHLGITLRIPSLGVAKNPYFGNIKIDWKSLKREKDNCAEITDGDELIGYITVLKDGSKPVFISKGYGIELELAVDMAQRTSKNHRQPEPLFLAHYYSKQKLKKIWKQ
ncbi:MAG: endonuclease V, partial [Promethearchaeota archaeon]